MHLNKTILLQLSILLLPSSHRTGLGTSVYILQLLLLLLPFSHGTLDLTRLGTSAWFFSNPVKHSHHECLSQNGKVMTYVAILALMCVCVVCVMSLHILVCMCAMFDKFTEQGAPQDK